MGDIRVIAQRILSGQIVDRDVQLKTPSITRELSGPGGVAGIANPELRAAVAGDGRPILDLWTTALYYEEDGQIRGGGIIQSLDFQGPALTVNAPGFCSYAAGQPIVKNYKPTAFEDPVMVFKKLWTYVQSYARSNIGLQVTGPSTYLRLGDGNGPYNINAHEYRDAGQELETIAQVAPFDYVETHKWLDSAHTRIGHELRVGFPRIGRLREDLRLIQGENIISHSVVALDGDRFANDVYVLGEGEGRGMIVGRASTDDDRLRRAAVIPRKTDRQGVANVYARNELRGRALAYDISEVVIRDHPNARIGAINPGDDILADIDIEHVGHVRMNLRVLSITEGGDAGTGKATLKTMRSDFFVYAPATSPTGKTVLVTT